MKNLIALWNDEEAATAVEYGLMAAAVAGIIMLTAFFLGKRVGNSMNNVAQHL